MSKTDALIRLTASGFGLGYLPLAPGTWASAAAAGVCLLLQRLEGRLGAGLLAALLLVVTVVGVLIAPRAEQIWGRSDPGFFVLDEIAGLWLAVLLFGRHGGAAGVVGVLVAFRVFDIAKPPPIRLLEELPGGWGVMLDDLAAALYSAAAAWLVWLGVVRRFGSG